MSTATAVLVLASGERIDVQVPESMPPLINAFAEDLGLKEPRCRIIFGVRVANHYLEHPAVRVWRSP